MGRAKQKPSSQSNKKTKPAHFNPDMTNTGFKEKLYRIWANEISLLLTISVISRVIFSFVYTPKKWPPTYMYLEQAKQFVSGDFTGYIGRLTPMYSFFMIATGFNFELLAVLQKVMAVVVTILVFLIIRNISGSKKIAFISALAYTLNPSQWLFESAYLTETVCIFLLATITYMVIRILDESHSARWWKYTILGILSAMLLLTRPQYQFMPLLLLIFTLWPLRKASLIRITICAVSLLLPVAVLLGSWLAFQHKHTGRVSTTIMTGTCLMYHPINFIEYAPDEYSEVKEILQNGIAEYLKRGNSYYGVVEAVIPEIQRTKGMNWAEVDSMYLSMAVATIKAKPLLYLKSVTKATARFFKPAWYSRQFGIRSVMAGDRLSSKIIAVGYSVVHLFLMATFLSFLLLLVVYPPFRRQEFFQDKVLYLYCLIIMTMSVQSILVLGENSRYRICVEPYMYGIAVWCLWRLAEELLERTKIQTSRLSN